MVLVRYIPSIYRDGESLIFSIPWRLGDLIHFTVVAIHTLQTKRSISSGLPLSPPTILCSEPISRINLFEIVILGRPFLPKM